MRAAGRYQVMTAAAGLLLAGSSVTAPATAGAGIVAPPVGLVAGESLLNVPFNLFQSLVNIPGTEVSATETLASSLLFTGNWWTPSATNIWGEDPGDPGHFIGLIDLLIPFREISGLGQPEIDPEAASNGTAGLGQQLALLATAWLPVDGSCAALSCPPTVPVDPITGITSLDRTLWLLHGLADPKSFPLIDNWFKVPLSELLNGYTFPGDATSPSPGVGPDGSVPGDDIFGFPGTRPGPDGENLMPWAGLDFKLNLLGPFENFANSLLATPDMDGFDLVGSTEVGRALQALLAGMVVDFNPFVPGSPVCPAACELPELMHLTTRHLVQAISDAWPGNTLVDHWLDLDAEGLANGPTTEGVDATIAGLQVGLFTFDPETTREVYEMLASIDPMLPYIVTHNGLLTDPAFAEWDGVSPAPVPEYGGVDPGALWFDYLTVLDPSGGLENSLTGVWDTLSDAWNGLFDLG